MAQEPGTPGPETPTERTPATPAPVELSDLAALKALAQPRRQRMLQHLTLHGPATSATLARALGLNTGSTSYHLRELARYGFVEETEAGAETGAGETVTGTGVAKAAESAAEERRTERAPGHGRERWWRAVPGDRRFPPRSRQSAEMRHVMDELNHHAYAADLELFEQLQRDSAESGPWADAFPYSRGTIRLTPAELGAFFEEYIALLNRYKRPEAETPIGARTVLTRFLAFPALLIDADADADVGGGADAATAGDADSEAGADVGAGVEVVLARPADATPVHNRKETEPS
ncbi:helix-turn-helix domain-containing protein [Streptomyces sp. NBC_01239]|uniref:ArsR/SmtB family transcription factor n=1 Tax=Streptomyces sp. NBC_01239 TaxID=2903792 RepID=UPI002259C2B9|nr:helix-turn-helix domain-containing protein [Streptomyces sp. NBC_01239]MCX4814333.1 helix-turn-helix domain-containing protein [Streptomyces sp. NBC_01239]